MQRINRDQAIHSFNAGIRPVVTAAPGATVVFVTRDCFSDQIQSEQDQLASVAWESINPATGPLAISGAVPGDTLVVDILDIKVADHGCMVCVPGEGGVGHLIEQSETLIIPIREGRALLDGRFSAPVRPMIGVIGTAPAEGDFPTGVPGRHGGNMDNRQIVAGTRLYLPVFVSGGLLALGDLHAVMGDGELSFCGVEVAGEVTVRVDLIRGRQRGWPVLESETDWSVIASGDDLDQAAQLAMTDALAFLRERSGLTVNRAVSLLSMAAHVEICQLVDPLKTVRVRLPKDVFTGLAF